MARITATYTDGRTLSWDDGVVSGTSQSLVLALDSAAKAEPWAQSMPEAPLSKTADWRTDPQAFLALTRLVHPDDGSPMLETTGDVGWPDPPPDGAN